MLSYRKCTRRNNLYEEATPSSEMEGDKRDQQFNEVEDKKK